MFPYVLNNHILVLQYYKIQVNFYENNMKFFRSQVLGSDGNSLWDIESSPGNSSSDLDRLEVGESSQKDTEDSELASQGKLPEGAAGSL